MSVQVRISRSQMPTIGAQVAMLRRRRRRSSASARANNSRARFSRGFTIARDGDRAPRRSSPHQMSLATKQKATASAQISRRKKKLAALGLPVIKEHPLDVLVVKNDPATLRCNVSGDNTKITWYKVKRAFFLVVEKKAAAKSVGAIDKSETSGRRACERGQRASSRAAERLAFSAERRS